MLATVFPAGAHGLSGAPAAASDTLRVTLSAPEGGTVAEGSTGHFEVSVAGSTAAGEVTVRYSVSGTAVAGEDYTALSGEATVSQGENTARIALEALKDGILDKGETVVLALTGATGPGTVLVDQTAATARIADNGTVAVALAAVSDTIGEGSTWNSSVIMSMPVADRISLRWRTQDGTALAGRDYKAADEVVTFQPGETVKPISVETLEDDNTETVEVFYVSLGLAVDAARIGTEGAFKVDPKPQSAFIECSVVFPPNVQTIFEFDKPVKSGTVIGTVAANTTGGIPYYELDDGGENKFTINSLTAQISTTAALDPSLYELEVTVHDECGAQASIDVSVNVKQPNRPPVVDDEIENMKLFVGEKKEIDLSTVFSDPDEDVLSYKAVSSKPAVATAVVSGTTLTVTAKGQGEATVTVTAKDPDDLEVTDVFKVTVPNRAPKPVGTIKPDTVDVGKSGSVGVASYFDDPDDDALEYAATSSSEGVVEVSVSGSTVTYKGLAEGSATVTVTATDPGKLSATQSFKVTVNQPNRAPTAVGTITDRTVDVGKSGSVGVASYFDDPDDDALEYAATSSSEGVVEVSVSGSTVTYKGLAEGSATVTVTATDPGKLSATQSFKVTVKQPNRRPTTVGTVTDRTVDVGKSGSVGVASYFDDPDDDALEYAATSSSEGVVEVSVSGSTVTYKGLAEGSATVTVTATDPGNLSATQSFKVTVSQPNRPPTTVDKIPNQRVELHTTGRVDVSDYFSDPDKDPLTYEASTVASAVARVSVEGSTVRFRGLRVGDATVKVTAKDAGGLTATQQFDVEVYPATQPECSITSVGDSTFTVGENATTVGTVRVRASDCGALDYELAGTGASDVSAAAVSVSNDDAAITGSFDFEGRSSYDLTLTVSERGGSASKSGRVRITVTDVNEAPKPVGSIGRQTVRVGRPGSLNVTGYFTDEDAGDRLTFTSKSSATGRLTVNASGSPVTLTGRAAGSATVTVTARDRGGLTATQVFSVTVEPAQQPCAVTVSDASLSVREDAGVGTEVSGVVGVNTTGDCGTLRYALTGTGSGDFSVAAAGASDEDGKIGVKRGLNHEGRDSYDLTLTVSEAGGTASGAGGVDITVTDVNEAPRAKGSIGTRTIRVGHPDSVDVTGYFTDEDAGDKLTFTSKSSATGRLTVNAGGSPVKLTGVAAGSATVTVTARDGGGLTATQAFSVKVDPAPKEPCEITVSDGALSVPEDTRVGEGLDSLVVVATKGDCGTLSYSLSGTGSGDFSVAAAGAGDDDARIGVAKALDHETKASYALTLTVRWGSASGTGAVGITVTDVNEAPEAAGAIPAVTLHAGDSKVVDVSSHFSDPDGDALTYAAGSSKEGVATVAAVGGKVTVTGVSPGGSQVTVTASDGRGGSAEQAFAVTVENRAPEVASAIPALRVAATKSKVVDVSEHFTDPDGDALTYAAGSSKEAIATVAAVGSVVTVTGVSEGESEVTVTARDPHGAEVSQAFAVTVGPENAAPEVASAIPALTVEAGETAVVDVSGRFRDPDGDPLSYGAASSAEAVATVAASGSELTVTGVSRGESQVTVTASDGRGGSVEQAFAVTVPNRPPVAVGSLGRAIAYQGRLTTVEVSGAFSDPDGDGLTYRAVARDPSVLDVRVDGSRVKLMGRARRATTVAVTADDGHGGTAEQTFEVTVPNHPPVHTGSIKPRKLAPGERFTVTLADYFRDLDGDTLTYTGAVLDSTVAAVSVEGAELAVLGVARGRTQVVGRAHDGFGGKGEQWFQVTVTNGAPSFAEESYEREVPENSAAGTAVGEPVAATDGDKDAVTHGFAAGGDEALFGIDAATGQITVAAGAVLNFESGKAAYTVSVEASDGALADTVGVTIRVTDVPAPGRPDPPVVTGGTEELSATWSAPANEGPAITGYDLRYRAKASSGWTEVSVAGSVLAHTITGLEAGTAYEAQVRAESSEGAGEWSESGEGQTARANTAPSFGAAAYEREVPENSAAGTAVGEPVTATDADDDDLTYSFIPGGAEVPFEIGSASGRITVAEGAALDHEGEPNSYAVQVEASDGTLADTTAVTIQVTDVPAPGKPDPPVVTGGTEEVSATWSAPSNEGPAITGYDLRYRAKADGDWTDPASLKVLLAYTITGLKAGTTYLVQVRARSSEGAGAWSDSGEGETARANTAPSFGADAYAREVPENSAAGTAVGDPITATDADDDDVAYSLVTGSNLPFAIDAGTGQIAVVEGAALDHEGERNSYAVQVEASDGTLADTTAVTIQVTDVPAPGKPGAPTVTGGTEEVAVSWSAPANEGPEITGYDYRYRAKADGGWSDPASLEVVLAHTITGLKAGTTYLVQVRARSSEGAGAWSESGEGETARANTAPSFGADAHEREVPENSAAGTAVGDPVTATDADDDDLTYSFVTGSNLPFAIVAGTGQIEVAAGAALDYESGKTAYTVSVEASDGTLADTTAVTIRVTDVPAPGKPDAPTVAGGTEEVSATWSAPANEGPAITGYDYRYRAEADGDWPDPASLEVVLAHTITGLKAGTKYLVQVRAVSSEGAGEWSDPGEGTTDPPPNRAPVFDADTYGREVPENSVAGTAVGDPVTATDADDDHLAYSFLAGGEAPFLIDGGTGRITVAEGAALNYESADTLYVVSVEARDRELADTASVTIRVTNADDPGTVTLNPEVARVGVEITPSLTDEDGVRSAGRKRKWQRSRNGNSWSTIATGRMYNPVTSDAGKWLRVVFTYTDGHGSGKRAESAAVKVLAANRAPAFGKDAYDRSVPENSPGGTNAGRPVQAEDDDGDELSYGLIGGGEAPFEVDAATGRIKVAEDAALNYESPDTLYTVHVEASDGTLADTASVTIRVKNADDPGEVALSPGVARVGVELTATLTDEDGVRDASRKRRWQRSTDGNSWRDIAAGGAYNPVTGDEGKWLRAVFTYRDGHGPGKRAESAAVKVLAANAAPSFPAVYERVVPENSPGGTKVGAPVAATDPDGTSPSYSLVPGGDEGLFGIDSSTGQIAVAGGAVLDYESGDTLLAVRVEASDGELADTASVKILVTNADDPGTIALSADVARVGVRLTATLTDQDRSIERGKMRTWQRSPDGAAWTMVVQGAQRRSYTPTGADRGKYLRAVFTYTDGHGPGKRAESPAVMVVGTTTPVVSFGAESYTAAPGGSADVAVLLSPAASSALAIEVVAADSARTVAFQTGAGSATLGIGTAGLSAGDTLAVRFGDLPDGVAVGVPAATRIVVAAVAGDRVSRSVVEDGSPTELEVEYAQAEYAAVAGGPVTEIALRVSPAADRRVAVPLTATHASSAESMLPDSIVFQPGDSLAAVVLEVPVDTEPGLLALGFGSLPEAVSAGAVASATVDIADHDPGPLRDEAFDLGLAVFGRAVAEGARQAVGARIDAVMRPAGSGSDTGVPGSAAEWAGRAAGTLASLTGAPLNASSAADMARRSGSVDLPTGREAVRRLLPSLSFATALGPQSAEGRPRLGLWAEGSAQSFRGDPGIDYDGGLRALTVGADARIGSSALLGVSLMRSDGDLDYGHRSAKGSIGHAMNSVHPYLFLRPSPGIGLWAMAGYGSGDVRDGDRHGDAGASLRMLSGGVRVPLARRGAFGLALNGDAFTVGMRADDEGREGSASRARALLEASWTAGGLKLATQAGARYDGGDADTGGGAETGASVGYATHGFDLDLRGRLALGSGRHREWGAALRLAFDPGTRGQGFRLAVSPRHGRHQNGIHGLMDGGTLHAMTPATGRDWRLDAEAGYGIRNSGAQGALDSYTRLSADGRNRSWAFGSRYSVSQTLRLGIEGSRSQLPGQNPNLGIRLALDFTF